MSKSPDKLFCWNFQTKEGGWEKGWGGYSRQENLYPMSEHERNTGGVYILMEAHLAEVEAAVKRALDGVDGQFSAWKNNRAQIEAAVKRALEGAAEYCDLVAMDNTGNIVREISDEIRQLDPAQFIDGDRDG